MGHRVRLSQLRTHSASELWRSAVFIQNKFEKNTQSIEFHQASLLRSILSGKWQERLEKEGGGIESKTQPKQQQLAKSKNRLSVSTKLHLFNSLPVCLGFNRCFWSRCQNSWAVDQTGDKRSSAAAGIRTNTQPSTTSRCWMLLQCFRTAGCNQSDSSL